MKKLIYFLLIALVLTACNSETNIIDNDSGVIVDNKSGNTIISGETQEDKVDMILEKMEKMTLKDKIEQMLILDYSLVPYSKEGDADATKLSSAVKEIIENHNFGGIILFRDNLVGTEQTFNLIKDIQESATTNNNTHKIPLFIAVDQEGGRVTRLSTGTSMPGNMALGAINDYATTKEYASVIGKELYSLGFNVDFAPVLDVNNNPSNPIIGVRSFSSDPNRVAKMGEAFIEGLQSEKIASTLKHFPGHGDTATDSHTGLPLINKSYEDIKSLELIPFKAGIDKGADMIMTAHIVYPQIETTKYISKKTGEEISLPATLSKTILTDILRNDLGFEGIIVTDALNMSAIAEHFDKKDAAKFALNAGVDILLMPVSLLNNDGNINDYVDMIAELVNNGEVDEKSIDESVYRILKLKEKMGILEENTIKFTNDDLGRALKTVGSKENHDKELRISRNAITLYKGAEMLPLDKNEKVLFMTSFANDKNSIEYGIQVLKEERILDESFDYEVVSFEKKEFSSFTNKISSASTVVITSDATSVNSFNSKLEAGWQARFIDSAIEEIHKQGKKVVVVSCMLPYDSAKYSEADAVVCAYGDRVIPELPIVYNGETKTFGVNVASAIIKLYSDEGFKATMPVDL